MNISNTGISARLFAGITIVSLLLSAFPVAFFVAQAATPIASIGSLSVAGSFDSFSGDINTTNYTNISLSFDYDGSAAGDGIDSGDTFKYGWRIGGNTSTEVELGSVHGAPGSDPSEAGTVTNLSLPTGAENITNLQIYFRIEGGSGGDELFVSHFSVDGDLVTTPACSPQFDDGLASGPVKNTTTGQFFTTIQNAIDDCDTVDGHTIEVSADTYNEAVMVNKSISLLGPNAAISAVTGTRVTEAVLTEQLRIASSVAADVEVSGFEFSDVDSPNFTIYVMGDSERFTFKNNRFINNTKVAIKTPETLVSKDITIEGNLIDGVTGANQSGLFLGGVSGNSIIRANKINNTAYGAILISTVDGVEISDNEISNIPQQGIQLAIDIKNAIIKNNVITNVNTEQKADKGAIRLYGSDVTGSVLITNNTISGGHNGIAIRDGSDITGKDIIITENDILAPDTGVQIYNGGTGELNVEKNWWGVDTGIQSSTGSTDSDPWLCGPFATNPDVSVGGACAVDTQKPVIAVDSPVNSVVVGSDFDITVTATDDVALDNVVVNLKDTDGTNLGTCLNESAGGATSYTATCTVDVDSLVEGTYTFKTNTRDQAGNLSQTLTRSFIVDKTRPVIVVDAPVDNLMTGAEFDIKVTATDDIGIGQVVINIKDELGINIGTCLNEIADGSTPYSTKCTISLTDYADGTYQFKTNAKDSAGNLSNTITQTFTINTNRPTIVVDSPTSIVTTDEDFDVTVIATDDQGIAKVVINIKDEFGAHLGTCLNETADGSSPYTTSCTINVDDLDEGTYNFRTNARDTTGNLSNTVNRQFIVDRTPTAKVTMCKVDEEENELAGWTLLLRGDKVGDYTVPANTPAGVDTDPLTAGASYIVVSEGTWDNNRGPLNIVDAEYSTEDNWLNSIMDGFTGFGTDILELFVGGTNGDWGPYNASHTYAQSYIPTVTGPVTLAINDSSYGDNTGELAATVYTGFTGVTKTNGCVVFEDVPYGDYEVAEIMQAGFENMSGLGPVTVDAQAETFTVMNTRLPEYGAYCGDKVVNQTWEQCEADDESGTCNLATCQYENQCSELNLVKIMLEESNSTSFDDTIYLGSATNFIPSGMWFNFDEIGDASAGSIANNTLGLGVERNQATQELYLAFRGGNGSGHIDSAIGSIEFMGAEVNASGVNRTPNPQFRLENGSGGSFKDVFAVTSSTTINFDLRADTGNDGVTVGLTDVQMCTLSVEPEQLYRLSGFKWDDTNGNGLFDEAQSEIETGESTIEGWEIILSQGDTIISTTTDKTGEYYFEVPAGTWTVTEETVTDWTQTGQYVNGSPLPTSDQSFGSCTFIIPSDTKSQLFYTCSFGNQEKTQTIDLDQTTPLVSELTTFTTNGRSGGGGGRRIERVPAPTPLVLGVTTDAPQFCPFITEYMQMDIENNSLEVMKLQIFLNVFKSMFGGTENPVTGKFDDTTDSNVKAFQAHFKEDVLTPWYERGLMSHDRPTGFVYKTTLWKINSIVCPNYSDLPDFTNEV